MSWLTIRQRAHLTKNSGIVRNAATYFSVTHCNFVMLSSPIGSWAPAQCNLYLRCHIISNDVHKIEAVMPDVNWISRCEWDIQRQVGNQQLLGSSNSTSVVNQRWPLSTGNGHIFTYESFIIHDGNNIQMAIPLTFGVQQVATWQD